MRAKMRAMYFSSVILLMVVLSGCVPVRNKSYLEYAHDAYRRGDFVAAYRLSEGYFDNGSSERDRAIAFVGSDLRIMAAGLSTFSKASLERTIRKHGNEAQAAKEERNRLMLFKLVGTSESFNEALENYKQVFPGYYENSERQEQLTAEGKREDELREKSERFKKDQALLKAANDYKVVCGSAVECKKMFALTQIFISEFATMKIQLATDVIIETYNITGGSGVAIKAVKTPGRGAREEISIHVSCKPYPSDTCDSTMMTIYETFPAYIKSKLH